MSDNNGQPPQEELREDEELLRRRLALELVFIAFLGITVVGALIAALNYDLVSARTPLVIMVPLLVLIAIQFNRTRKLAENHVVIEQVSRALRGGNGDFNRIIGFIGLMAALLFLIWFAGHYVGISVFMFVLLRTISREHPVLALVVAIGVTVLIYFLFEHGFNIELYRGFLPRLLMRDAFL